MILQTLSNDQCRSVKLAYTSLGMPLASATKPAVKGSPDEMVDPWNHRFIPLYVHLPSKCRLFSFTLRLHMLKNQRAQTVLKSSRISRNLPKGLKSSVVSGNHPFYPKNLLFENSPDCQEIMQAVKNVFPKSFTPSKNSLDCPKSPRLSKSLQESPEIFKTVSKPSRLLRSLQDCLEVVCLPWLFLTSLISETMISDV